VDQQETSMSTTSQAARTSRTDRGRRRAVRLRRAVAAVLRGEGVPRDAGMATAEYAIVMIAAVGFAGLLIVILSSAEVRETLTSLVRDALSV
jgi:hypothetical protein